ncbi:hypothetical protein C7R88_07835 [Plesiomonas shigelloides]|nr:hypothetical protein C7R88_07835 [Plesiomonas shigelloides]
MNRSDRVTAAGRNRRSEKGHYINIFKTACAGIRHTETVRFGTFAFLVLQIVGHLLQAVALSWRGIAPRVYNKLADLRFSVKCQSSAKMAE